ncbi:MAG: 7-carboxy-7-deazaguanine synthase QueE [Treponema sp.]|nr:7-carboxy-7-deazaguanine synthase QueE [Treponema sp.]
MKVLEIFKSIQGEGSHLGLPAVFVRFALCNLNCSFCDTKESWTDKNAKEMSIDEIIKKIEELHAKRVIVTGGEPCIQKDINLFIDTLHKNGYTVDMETNASLPTPNADWIVASPKACNGYKINELCKANELKYVVTKDFDDKVAIPEDIRNRFTGKIWLQPDGYNMQETWQKAYDIALQDTRLRVGVQLHKIMSVR